MSEKILRKLAGIFAKQQLILEKLAQMAEQPADELEARYNPDLFDWEDREKQMQEESAQLKHQQKLQAEIAELKSMKAKLEQQGLAQSKVKALIRQEMFDRGLIPWSQQALEKKRSQDPDFEG